MDAPWSASRAGTWSRCEGAFLSVSTNDLKNGMTLDLDGSLFQVVEFQHVKPGKGGAFVRSKLRNVKTGAVVERTFNAGVKVGLAIVERKQMQYLYADGDDFVFMDMDTYEQVHVPASVIGDTTRFLAPSAEAQVAMHQGVPIAVELPASVVLTITQTDPGAKGDTRTGSLKPAVVETGTTVQVPLFVEEGERIKVDTRSGDYIERVKA
jgi:elongation factor P